MNVPPRHFFEFDDFRISVEERRLLRKGQTVSLTPKAFDVLLALTRNAGRTVDKNELMETVWRDTFVEEGNLNRHISTLRKILGDDPREQRFIKTIPKQGYRFTAEVRELIDTDSTLAIENISRSRVIIREETQEGFWTPTRLAIGAACVLAVSFLGAWVIASATGGTRSPNREAAAAYQRGRALWQTRRAGDLHEATLLLEQAVQKDPDFALAHAALADAYAFDYHYWKKAAEQAAIAIKLDPSLGQPHATIGFVRMFWEWDLPSAETALKKAVDLSPEYATARQWYAANLAATAHIDAALVEIRKASELEPLSPSISADYCQILYFAKRYDEALTQCLNTLHLDAGFLAAHQLIYEIYSAKGMYNEAVEKFIENEYMSNHKLPPEVGENLRQEYANSGIVGFRMAQAEIFADAGAYYKAAQNYARIGETEKAINALLIAYERRDFDLIFFLADPVFAEMWQLMDDRISTLVQKLRGARGF